MGARSRGYRRQVGSCSLTPIPKIIFLSTPVILLVLASALAVNLWTQATTAIISAAGDMLQKPEASTATQLNDRQDLGLSLFTPEVQRWSAEIQRWSFEHKLPLPLIALVMQIESCGGPNARSHAGAAGLFQVMPFHFAAGEDPYHPDTNAARGLAYLARAYELSDRSIDRTLAGYNGGHSQIGRDPRSWPAETQRYVAWGVGIWRDIEAQREESISLMQWLEAGGARLCFEAMSDPVLP